MTFKVLVTDGRMPHYRFEEEILRKIGAELVFSGISFGQRDDEKLKTAVRYADALLVSQANITRDIIASMERCKVIVRYGIGTDTIDIPAATEKGIMVANVVDHCISEVSDTALALILNLARKTILSARQVRKGLWGVAELKPIHRISKQVLGILGCGRIGRDVAKKALAIGFKVVGYDPYVSEDVALKSGIALVSLDELFNTSDIISLHLPLNAETINIINQDNLAKMKWGASIVNVSRGQLIDEQALIKSIIRGEIAGAGLDVTCQEPIERDNPLLYVDNVIITAHTAWYSNESNEELQRKAAQIVANALTGKFIDTLLNREVLT